MKKTCLIGPPARMGVSAGARCRLVGWIWRSAFGVRCLILRSLGEGRRSEVPRTSDGRCGRLLMKSSESLGEFGLGPFGFGPTPRPRAEIHASLRSADRA